MALMMAHCSAGEHPHAAGPSDQTSRLRYTRVSQVVSPKPSRHREMPGRTRSCPYYVERWFPGAVPAVTPGTTRRQAPRPRPCKVPREGRFSDGPASGDCAW